MNGTLVFYLLPVVTYFSYIIKLGNRLGRAHEVLSARIRVISLSSRMTSEVISKGLWVEQVLNDRGDQQEERGHSQNSGWRSGAWTGIDSGIEKEKVGKRAYSNIKWVESRECLDVGWIQEAKRTLGVGAGNNAVPWVDREPRGQCRVINRPGLPWTNQVFPRRQHAQ